jgi:hypothetical protein
MPQISVVMFIYYIQYVQSEVLTVVIMKASVLWTLLATRFMLLSSLAYSSSLKLEATCFPETSICFQRTTWRYIPGLYNLTLIISRIQQ